MKTNLRLVLLCCLCFSYLNFLNGQVTIPEFGKVSVEELSMKECPFEKGANAMNLVREAKIGFGYNDISGVFSIKTETTFRIKIFNKLGFSSSNIKIPYLSNSRYEKITDIEAFLYSMDSDGRIVKEKLVRKDIFREKTSEKNTFDYVSFTFPNLNPGAVIEYRYTRTDKNTRFLMPWFFQDELPTSFSKVTLVVPTYVFMRYYVLADPVIKDSSFRKYEGGLYNEEARAYAMRNIHSFKVEPLMTSVKDNLQRVEFSLKQSGFIEKQFRDVPSYINYQLLWTNEFGLQFAKPIPGSEKFIDSVKQAKSLVDKIEAVFNYVRKNVEWNGEETFYCNDSLSQCWKNKTASNAEMNLLLLNLLRKAGVSAYPLLVSSHENGSPDMNVATVSQFNGVDVLVNDSVTRRKYFLDCTQKDLSFRIPPYNVLNSFGYIIDPFKNSWVLILDPRILLKTEISVDATIDSSGHVAGKSNMLFWGYSKAQTLRELKEKKSKVNAQENDLAGTFPGITVDSMVIPNTYEDNDSLLIKNHFHLNISPNGGFYFFSPFMFSSFKKNPFIENERYTDIDFGSSQMYSTKIDLKIPKSFTIESLPKDIMMYKADSTISFTRTIVQESDHILIRNYFVIKNANFIKEDYGDLKTFFDKFYSLFNDEIILKSK
jgi:hypothetical protein